MDSQDYLNHILQDRDRFIKMLNRESEPLADGNKQRANGIEFSWFKKKDPQKVSSPSLTTLRVA